MDADTGGVRHEAEGQPPVGRAQGGVGHGFLAEHGRPVTVLGGRLVEPAQRLPRLGPEQVLDPGAEQFGGPGADEGDPSVGTEGAAAARQALGEVHRGLRLVGSGGPLPGRRQQHRLGGGPYRVAVLGRRPQEQPQTVTGFGDLLPLPRGRPRRMRGRPLQHQTAPDVGAGGDRHGDQGEAVRHDQGQPWIPARQLLLPAHRHRPALPDGVGHRGGRLQCHPRPGQGDVPGDPAQHRQLQHRLVRYRQIRRRRRGAALPGQLGQHGLQPLRTVGARTGQLPHPPRTGGTTVPRAHRTSPICGPYASAATPACRPARPGSGPVSPDRRRRRSRSRPGPRR